MPVRYRNAPGLSDVLGPVARVNAAASVRLHSGEGQTIRLTSSRIRLSPIGPIPVTVDLRVAKVQFTGPLDKTPEIEVSEATARTLTGDLSGVDAFEARVADPGRTEELAGAVRASLGADYRVQTWRELNAPLAFALRLEKAVIFVTVALVILVAALNIVSNIALTVVEKKRDLGVFTAMGSPPVSIERIYLTLGAVIGVIGTATGVVFGVGLSLLLDRYPLVKLPDVYLISRVPFSVYPGEVAGVAAFALLTAIGAALLPARAAARLAPGEAIRLSR
jgi:lipoprotein-releasing system permease protein